jgi:hypothetical protein
VEAHPSPTSILEWFFVIEGVKDTPFVGGVYMGKVREHAWFEGQYARIPLLPLTAVVVRALTHNSYWSVDYIQSAVSLQAAGNFNAYT